MSRHHYQDWALKYLAAGIPCIPDKWGSKLPSVKAWNKTEVTEKQVLEWSNNLQESNIAMLTGKVSGIVVLDFDCVDEELIKKIEYMMPPSPVERFGSKGWARFFRYTAEQSYQVKHNGEVVLEILSDGKKLTLPPSKHPSGLDYKWKDNVELLSVDSSQLPVLPPFLIPELEQILRASNKNTSMQGNKIVNGRNDALSQLCSKLIQENTDISKAVEKLVKFDEETNENPLFSDQEEMQHTERRTNALMFYTNHLNSFNAKRFRKNEAYEVPMIADAVSSVYKEEVLGKSELQQESQESSKNIEFSDLAGGKRLTGWQRDQIVLEHSHGLGSYRELAEKYGVSKNTILNIMKANKKVDATLPTPTGVIKEVQDHILQNSFIPQPAFAFSAALSLMAVLTSRKILFETGSTNLYILNVAGSGSGKDSCQQALKQILAQLNADHLLGAGDYVSDASLMDSLPVNPVRLDIIDEASGLFNVANSGRADYNAKMADILAELYTHSNATFLGRSLAEGRKGACERPNVNLLCSTTPSGLKESMSQMAIDKGLLGRFLIFRGLENQRAVRVRDVTPLGEDTLKKLAYWVNFTSPSTEMGIGAMTHQVYKLPITKDADAELNKLHSGFQDIKMNLPQDSSVVPIVNRLYQQMSKIIALSACSRVDHDLPEINLEDVIFGHKTIMYFYDTIQDVIRNTIFKNKIEKLTKEVVNLIEQYGLAGVSSQELYRQLMHIDIHKRKALLQDLIDHRIVMINRENRDGEEVLVYRSVR